MPDNWNGLRLGALGFQPPPMAPPPQPEITPEMLLALGINPFGFTPPMRNPMQGGPPPMLGPTPPPRNEAERAVEGSQGIDYGAPPGLMPGGPPPPPTNLIPAPSDSTVFRPNELAPNYHELLDRERGERIRTMAEEGGNVAPLPGGGQIPSILSAIGRLARAPRTTAAATVGGATALGTGETQTPSELDTVRTNEGTARTTHAAALKRQQELEADIERYNPARILRLTGEDRARAVKEIQEELGRTTDADDNPLYRGRNRDRQGRWQPGPVDGRWEGGTTAAAGARRRQLQEELRTARAATEEANKNLTGLGTRLDALKRQAARDAAEANRNPIDRLVHQYSGPLGFATGSVGGNLLTWPSRALATRGMNAVADARVRSANALLDRPRQDISGRFGGLNEFYARGGGREPLRHAPTAAGGFTETNRGRATPAGNLYPPRTVMGSTRAAEFLHPGADSAVVGAMGAGVGYQEYSLHTARQELEAARAGNDGSRQAQDRLAQAESAFAYANLRANIMRGAPLSYPLTAIGLRYRDPRPDVQRGAAELHRLSQWRRRQ